MTVLGKVTEAEFSGRALPGDRMILDVELVSSRPEGSICEGEARVGDRRIGRARFMLPYLPPELEPRKDAAWHRRRDQLIRAWGVEEAQR
jgi:hypothetical protein